MSASKDIVVAFDLYGTLLSTYSIGQKLSEHFGKEKGAELAATWRKYQLEYTWRLNSMGQFIPFSDVTRRSLLNTLGENALSATDAQIADLMAAYDSLSSFPDVTSALKDLASTPGITPVVFSNGTSQMVRNSVHKSPDLAPHAGLFKDLIVVEETKRFKPDPEVYRYLARRVGKDDKNPEDMASMWLISGNPFDVVGARATGMKSAWVDRTGAGWVDALVAGEQGQPTEIIKGLGEVAQAVKKHAGQ